MEKELKVGSYVTDSSETGRYSAPNIFRIEGFSFDRAIVRHVGVIENGRPARMHASGAVTHRTTANLREWT